MARNLTFKVKGAEYAAAPVKVDRAKLYGWTALKALDDDGKECQLVSMDESGSVIIPKGGMAQGILSPEREWVERSSLKAVKAGGGAAELVPSSYSAPIDLKTKADTDTFLDHNITAVYHLDTDDAKFVKAVGDGIFVFDYCFRDSYKTDPAFVMASGGALFMLVGQKAEYEMIGLAQAETIDDENSDEEEEEDSGDLDFSMM
jgi:hypothetical protein